MNKPIKEIAEAILQQTGIFQKYFLDARRDEEGRVLIPIESNGNEKAFAGISDVSGPFFYLRWRNDFIIYEELREDRRFSSCENFAEQLSPLRLVGVFPANSVDAYQLEGMIRKAIMSFKINNESGIKSGKAVLRQSLVDSISVIKEELKNAKKFDKDLGFILFDFDLSIEIVSTCDSKSLIL